MQKAASRSASLGKTVTANWLNCTGDT